ncbi:hypothetical protein BDQ17DRAFT_1284127 [Cyathus striatus]|nr:hypothetical protein BDQ17DRAFT_1434475 [Cyathus striatus]KAF8997083.1 hypothetical protein BDQ17DRAFT_1284127 [Cyathus striatus]
MPSLADSKSHNSSFALPDTPVAVFVGGTAGIGEAMARAFARYTNGKAHIIIMGRNQTAADSIIASFPPPGKEGKYEFIKCDVALMKNIYDACEKVLSHVSKINYLVLSAGLSSFSGRDDTKEGLDKKMVLRYYSRWAFIDGLLPGLRLAREKGEQASALSILAAGLAPKVNTTDLGLKKRYGDVQAHLQTGGYNDMMVSELANREPGIAFTHMFPGWVKHPRPSIEGLWMSILYYILIPIVWLTGSLMYPEESAEYHLYALFQGKRGMYRRNQKGDDIGMKRFPGTEVDQTKVWQHSYEEISRARETSR